MKKVLGVAALVLAIGGWQLAMAQSVGNPIPGVPHDTIMIHMLKAGMAERQCQPGGHSLFLHYEQFNPGPPSYLPIKMYITMTNWVDWDGNGKPTDDYGVVQPGEEGGITKALDCDSLPDGIVKLQIRDTEGEKRGDPGRVSTQEWFIRLVGKPFTADGTQHNFKFTSGAEQLTCTVLADGSVSCIPEAYFELAKFNLAEGVGDLDGDGNTTGPYEGPCVKQVKKGGGGTGKTPFCNITSGFLVDVALDGGGVAEDAFIFTMPCPADDPLTLTVDESQFCPVRIVWDVDDVTDSMAKAQVFVSHTGSASVVSGNIKKP